MQKFKYACDLITLFEEKQIKFDKASPLSEIIYKIYLKQKLHLHSLEAIYPSIDIRFMARSIIETTALLEYLSNNNNHNNWEALGDIENLKILQMKDDGENNLSIELKNNIRKNAWKWNFFLKSK